MTNKSVKMTVLGLAVAVASSSYAQKALESTRKGGEPGAGKNLERPKATELLQGKPEQAPSARLQGTGVGRGLSLKAVAVDPARDPYKQFEQQVIPNFKVNGQVPTAYSAGSLNLTPSKAFAPGTAPVSVHKLTRQVVEAGQYVTSLETQAGKTEAPHITPDFAAQARNMVAEGSQLYVDALKEFERVAASAKTANPLDDPALKDRLHDVGFVVLFAGNQLLLVLRESAELAKSQPDVALASVEGYVKKARSLAAVVSGASMVAALGDAKEAKQLEESCGI